MQICIRKSGERRVCHPFPLESYTYASAREKVANRANTPCVTVSHINHTLRICDTKGVDGVKTQKRACVTLWFINQTHRNSIAKKW